MNIILVFSIKSYKVVDFLLKERVVMMMNKKKREQNEKVNRECLNISDDMLWSVTGGKGTGYGAIKKPQVSVERKYTSVAGSIDVFDEDKN